MTTARSNCLLYSSILGSCFLDHLGFRMVFFIMVRSLSCGWFFEGLLVFWGISKGALSYLMKTMIFKKKTSNFVKEKREYFSQKFSLFI